MSRLWKHPKGLTWQDLQNNDWDVIELDITVDVEPLQQWYKEVTEKNTDCIWTMDRDDLVDEECKDKFLAQRTKILVGIPQQWTLQWSYQREGVLPFKGIACRKQFPECYEKDFNNRWNQNLSKYYYGAWKNYYDYLGPDCFAISRLVRFPKGMGLSTHVDTGENQPYLIRMHTLIDIGPKHWLNWGDDLDDKSRWYKLETGKVYLLNTGMPHAAINWNEDPWVMLHNNPNEAAVNRLLGMSEHIKL